MIVEGAGPDAARGETGMDGRGASWCATRTNRSVPPTSDSPAPVNRSRRRAASPCKATARFVLPGRVGKRGRADGDGGARYRPVAEHGTEGADDRRCACDETEAKPGETVELAERAQDNSGQADQVRCETESPDRDRRRPRQRSATRRGQPDDRRAPRAEQGRRRGRRGCSGWRARRSPPRRGRSSVEPIGDRPRGRPRAMRRRGCHRSARRWRRSPPGASSGSSRMAISVPGAAASAIPSANR